MVQALDVLLLFGVDWLTRVLLDLVSDCRRLAYKRVMTVLFSRGVLVLNAGSPQALLQGWTFSSISSQALAAHSLHLAAGGGCFSADILVDTVTLTVLTKNP